MLCASCCDSGCPVPHQSTATTSPVAPLTPSGHPGWTASGLPGNGMGFLGTVRTAARELHPHCAPSSFFMPACFSIGTLDDMPITHAWVGLLSFIKKWAFSLPPAFPKDPTSVISPSVVRLLHWPLWDTPCPCCFTRQAFHSHFLMVKQTQELNLLERNFFFFSGFHFFQPDISLIQCRTGPYHLDRDSPGSGNKQVAWACVGST